ncbi:salt tolerance down-regulator-domain-containing protein [Fimicolochytrium jonesii]|uniref:salt tolerance down-regulator-domain-containing protein n=1 Tax=Fimicolochytrium jonesii TaxID=1396493 RepID=UPI0022FE1980|nr:salt tolerance down-regulator-domain-containing protein [Fimicolochytrium jonesii]KAI8824373.1 salt tolerance down-regulator-domain-containing protein [Fimicolochytrium jonesii]
MIKPHPSEGAKRYADEGSPSNSRSTLVYTCWLKQGKKGSKGPGHSPSHHTHQHATSNGATPQGHVDDEELDDGYVDEEVYHARGRGQNRDHTASHQQSLSPGDEPLTDDDETSPAYQPRNNSEGKKKKKKKRGSTAGHSHQHADIWYKSDAEEKQRIREFWLQLGEEERRALVKLEKEAVLKKMKEQQKQTCSCSVCGRKRTVIEEELEILYDAYYEELEHFANDQDGTPRPIAVPAIRAAPPLHNGRHTHPVPEPIYDDDEEDDDEEDDDDDEYDHDPSESIFEFGSSLTVKGGILTVADDFLKNDGRKFLDLMEQLAERKIRQLDDEMDRNGDGGQEYDDGEYDDEEYDEEEEEDTLTEEQRMEEGRRMFQIFAAKMFEQRVLQAYREKVAQERQMHLLAELEKEKELQALRELTRQKNKEKKRQQKKAQKQQKEEEQLALEKKKQEEEERLRAEKEAKQEAERLKREAEKQKREEEKARREEEERKKREAEKLRKEEEKRKQREAEERKKREKEERERLEREKREREDREKKEREDKERKEREKREQEEREQRDREEKERRDQEDRARAEKQRQEAQLRHQQAKSAKSPPGKAAAVSGPQFKGHSSPSNQPHSTRSTLGGRAPALAVRPGSKPQFSSGAPGSQIQRPPSASGPLSNAPTSPPPHPTNSVPSQAGRSGQTVTAAPHPNSLSPHGQHPGQPSNNRHPMAFGVPGQRPGPMFGQPPLHSAMLHGQPLPHYLPGPPAHQQPNAIPPPPSSSSMLGDAQSPPDLFANASFPAIGWGAPEQAPLPLGYHPGQAQSGGVSQAHSVRHLQSDNAVQPIGGNKPISRPAPIRRPSAVPSQGLENFARMGVRDDDEGVAGSAALGGEVLNDDERITGGSAWRRPSVPSNGMSGPPAVAMSIPPGSMGAQHPLDVFGAGTPPNVGAANNALRMFDGFSPFGGTWTVTEPMGTQSTFTEPGRHRTGTSPNLTAFSPPPGGRSPGLEASSASHLLAPGFFPLGYMGPTSTPPPTGGGNIPVPLNSPAGPIGAAPGSGRPQNFGGQAQPQGSQQKIQQQQPQRMW